MTRPARRASASAPGTPGPRQRDAADPVAAGDLAATSARRAAGPPAAPRDAVDALARHRAQSTHATLDPQRVAEFLVVVGADLAARRPCWAVVTADVDGQLAVLAEPRAAPRRWRRRSRPSAAG